MSTVFLIVHQPQIQLIEFGTEKWVHVLRDEGPLVFRESSSSRPGRRRRRQPRFSDADERLLWFSDLADFKELQKSFDAPLAEPRLGAVAATERHLEYRLQATETRETN